MWSLESPERQPLCSACGARLTGDMDDDPSHPTGPLCGDCYRAQEDDELMWMLDTTDEDEDIW